MRQFTIITKDGSKWLRPVLNPSDTDQLSRFFQNAGDGFEDSPYIGSRPEGTTVDESEVREVRQYRKIAAGLDWTTCPSEQVEKAATDRPSFELRTAYTDAESHDRHISNEVHPVLAWLRTNGEISEDRKHVTYSCEEIEAFFNRPNWMRFKEESK